MSDKFGTFADSVSAPARATTVLVPNDTADLTETPKGVYIGTGGDVALVAVDAPTGAASVTFRNLPSGSLLPVRARRVFATGTTAADLVALF